MYAEYEACLRDVVASGDLSAFKTAPALTTIYEHTSRAQAEGYLAAVRARFGAAVPDAAIAAYCALNDRDGGAVRAAFDGGRLVSSPSSLRYVLQALLALDHARASGLAAVTLVEVGGGYGGLALAVNAFAPTLGVTVAKYCIVDLPAAGALQRLYTGAHTLAFPVEVHDAGTYGADVAPAPGAPLLFVSNYAYSEIEAAHQAGYRVALLPRCAAGFLTWNHVPVHDVGHAATMAVEDEVPLTGPGNKYVRF